MAKNGPKTRENSQIWWGWVKITKKNAKHAISQKGLANLFLKIGKIHVIYVYIKKQKQTDELLKSQVGCALGEVWGEATVLACPQCTDNSIRTWEVAQKKFD